MYPPHSLGGYELLWQSWVRNAVAKGHDVTVLTTDVRFDGAGGDDGPEDVRRTLRWYWSEHAWPRRSVRERLRIERANAALLDATLAELRPDAVVWWAMAGMSLSAIERVRRAGIPAVAVLDDYWLEYGLEVDGWQARWSGRLRPLRRLVEALTGQIVGVDLAADVTCVFTTDWMRARAQERVPQVRDVEVVHHPPPEVERFALAPERPWSWALGYVGRIVDVKGVDLAVDALALLPASATLAIYGRGDDDYERALVARAAELGLDGRVSFHRLPREELPAAYAGGDVTLFPVRWAEPFGLVPLEAMAVGRPVIASGRGGSGEILSDGENCLIADPDDGPEALAARIRELAEDPDLRARLRAGGQRTVARIVDERFDDTVLAIVESRVAARRQGAAAGEP
jgi:glycosyltransferase involved in cell wall biosynthesis